MKVFISQPMADRNEADIQRERDKILDGLRKEITEPVIEVPSFLRESYRGHKFEPVYYLAMSIKMLSDADFAVFAPGWEKARGCRIEHMACREYGIPYRDLKK